MPFLGAHPFDRAAAYIRRRRAPALAVAIALGVAGGWYGSDVPIRLSISDLLPEDKPSVQDTIAVSQAVGGVGYLGVLVGPLDEPQRFVAQAAAALEGRPDIRYAFYERDAYVLRDKAPYVMPRAEFDELNRYARILLREGSTAGAIDLGVETPEERAANEADAQAFFDRLKSKYLGGKPGMSSDTQRYFISKDGRHAMVFAKPTFDSADLGLAMSLVEGARGAVREALGPDVPFRLWGRYVNQVTDTRQVQSDIRTASLISVTAVLLLLIFGMGDVRSAVVSLGCVIASMGWTAGFVELAIGRINIVTGFMLAILSGLGVEYGIHLIRRFQEEIAAGRSREAALEIAHTRTGRALLSAALTSAGAFLILGTSDFRGFSELGLIAGAGVLSIYAVYMLAFPALSRVLPERPMFERATHLFGWYPVRRWWLWAVPIVAAIAVFGFTRARLEEDLQNMRKLSYEANEMNNLVVALMGGRSTTPAALLAPSAEAADEVRDALLKDEYKPRVQDAVTLHSIVPPDQEERYRAMALLRKALRRASDEEIRERVGLDPALARAWVNEKPYTPDAIPRRLTEALGGGKVVAVYTDDRLNRIDDIQEFAEMMKRLKERFPEVRIGTDAMILAEIIHYVFVGGRFVLVLFAFGSFLVMWLDFRSLRSALVLELQLVLGIALLTALMGLAGVPFTIFNIAMVPAVLAAGIDMGVHVRHRQLEEGAPPLEAAREVAKSVQLGALTTLFGFGSLLVAQADVLRGISWISCLGQIAMYLVCMVTVPLIQQAFADRRRS